MSKLDKSYKCYPTDSIPPPRINRIIEIEGYSQLDGRYEWHDNYHYYDVNRDKIVHYTTFNLYSAIFHWKIISL